MLSLGKWLRRIIAVQKFGRTMVILGGVILLLVLIAFIGANLYVQARATQERIEQELRHRLGVDVRIGQISVTPWAGIELSGITVPHAPGVAETAPFLQAEHIRLRLRLLSLLRKRLVVKKVSVLGPTVSWSEDAEGKWRLPLAQVNSLGKRAPNPVEAATPEPAVTSPAMAPVTPMAESAPAAEPQSSRGAAHEEPLEPEIRHVVIRDGNFNFTDRAGASVARFAAVDFRSTLGASGDVRGEARVDRVTVRDRFDFSDLRTDVSYDDVTLKLTQFRASVAGGKLEGELQVEPQTTGAPFNVKARFSAVDADELIVGAGGKRGVVRGKLEGSLTANGRSGQPNELGGAGELFLRDGQLQQYSLLVALGQVLQIDELTQLHLDEAFAKYHVADGSIAVDQLLLRSPNIQLSGKGNVAFDGRMHLDAQLAVNEKVQARLFRAIRDNFHPTDQPGYAAVDFEVNGTIDRPKTNLVEKLVGRDLKDLGSVINSFLGGGKSERKRRKAAAAEENAPSPLASPAQPAPTP